ncbi:hypothetical protein ACTNEW_01615 [Blautia sp. HCP3S3_G3]|uniref:hypothetical protein n=1 Tax=Blautia sp. HCP3S3_G3 TaxID=3438913 RepID=UPI003F8CF0BC
MSESKFQTHSGKVSSTLWESFKHTLRNIKHSPGNVLSNALCENVLDILSSRGKVVNQIIIYRGAGEDRLR